MGISGCHLDCEGNAIVAAGLDRTVLLHSALHAFIQQHVLCRKCRSSETTIVSLDVEHRATIVKCIVCGTKASSKDQACVPFFNWLQQTGSFAHFQSPTYTQYEGLQTSRTTMCFLQPMIMRRVGDGTSHSALMQQIRRLQGKVHVLRLSNAAASVEVVAACRVARAVPISISGSYSVIPRVCICLWMS
jgi:hypothetical protein